MKRIFSILAGLVVAISALIAEPSLTFTGAGTASVNGTYEFAGKYNDKPQWRKSVGAGTYNYVRWSTSAPVSGGGYVIDIPAGNAYYGTVGNADAHGTNWTLGAQGANPVPAKPKYVLPQLAPAYPPVIVAGAGSGGANGTFDYVGLINGRPFYAKNPDVGVPYYLAYDSANSRWRIFVYSPNLTEAYRVSSTVRTPDLIAGTWSTQLAGSAPAPTGVTASARLVLDGGSIIESGARKTWDAGSLISGAAGRFTLVVGTPVSTPRALPGSTNSVTTEDRTVQTVTGSATVTDYTWAWTPADSNTIPGTVTRSSVNPAVITPHSTDPYLWTFASNGTATIRLTTSTGLIYNRSVTTSTTGGSTTSSVTGYAAGSLRKHLFDTFAAKLAGKSPATDLRLFSTYNPSTATYTRNASCWAYGNAGGVTWDLTAISPGNSGANNLWVGILISPRHILLCAHASMANGSTIHFVTNDNQVITRTMTSATTVAGYTSYYPDLRVGVLDSEVPSSIKVAKILPDDWASKFPSLGSTYPIPSIGLDQEEKATVQDIYLQSSSAGMYGAMVNTSTPLDPVRSSFFESKIGGDSGNPLVTPIGNELVVWTVWTFGGAGSGTSLWYNRDLVNAVMAAQTDYPYVQLNGSTQYISTPDNNALDVTGDIDIRVKVRLTDWTPTANHSIVSKYDGAANQRSYLLQVTPAGNLQLITSNNGTGTVLATSTVATGVSDNTIRWIRATRDVDNGSSGQTTVFYTSTDGATWSQLGSAVTNAGTTSIFAGTASLRLGMQGNGSEATNGKIYYAEVRSGIDGTVVGRFDPIKLAYTNSSYTDSVNSLVWTLNASPAIGGYALQAINLSAYNSY